MLSEEQAKNIKEQIISQIDSWHATEQQKQEAKKQIQEMPTKELEAFLIKNKLIKSGQESKETEQEKQSETKHQCPFCLIVGKKISSHIIDENKTSLAVLEINPLSKGHTLVISKKHQAIEKIPSQAFTLAKKISRKLKLKLKPENISIQSAELFQHGAINIIPVYKGIELKKYSASQNELKEIQEKLISKRKPQTEIIREKKSRKPEHLEKAPIRMP